LYTSYDAVKILHDALLLTEGRDKVVKLLQYSSRLILLLSTTPSKRLRPFISQMSMTRKVIKLGHGIFPYMELTKGGLRTFMVVRALVEFLNDFWDDVYCLSRIGLLRSPKVQRWSENWANRSWLTGIIMDIYVLMQKRKATALKLEGSKEKHLEIALEGERVNGRKILAVESYWIDVSIAKLLADFGFCGTFA
jgi:Peroxisomal biogenesis factor 11 (PEX11)